MALSPIVLTELNALKTYYTSLSKFNRWFLPIGLRKTLDELEALTLSEGLEVSSLIQQLCIALEEPDWYGNLVLGWFSGITMFLNATLMSAVRTRVIQKSALTVEDLNLLVEAAYSPIVTVKAMRFYDSFYPEVQIEALAPRKEVIAAMNYLLHQPVRLLPLLIKRQLAKLAMTHLTPELYVLEMCNLYLGGHFVLTQAGEIDFTVENKNSSRAAEGDLEVKEALSELPTWNKSVSTGVSAVQYGLGVLTVVSSTTDVLDGNGLDASQSSHALHASSV